MAIYMLEILASMSYAYFLNGMGALNLQLIFTVGAALAFIPLTWLAVKTVSPRIESIVLAMIIVNLPGLVVNMIQYYKIMRGTAQGIWRQ